MSDGEAWRNELKAHTRRLAILKEQAAISGINRDPRLDIEIEDIEQQVGELERKLGLAPSQPPAGDSLSPPLDHAGSAGGDMIIANISSSSKVAVGKQISQIDHAGAPAGQPDREVIEVGLAALAAALDRARGQLDPALASMATFQISLLSGELAKAESETPSANTIVMVGDWLLSNLPQFGGPIKALLAAPAVGRAIERAGGAAPAWRARLVDPPAA